MPSTSSTATSTNFIHPLNKLLAANPYGIARLLAQTQKLEAIAREIANILPVNFISHYRVANLRGTLLVLQVDSSAWATRLRYQEPAIIEHLRSHGWPTLTATKIHISVPNSHFAPPPLVMSKSAISLFHNLAKTCPDAELRAAWERIASHHR